MLKPGDKVETVIEKIGIQGDGVGSLDGLNVIVPLTAVGDKVLCQVKYSQKDRIHANLLEVREPAPGRVTAPCIYYSKCGGCNLQHINADEYKKYKIGLLTGALEQSGVPAPQDIGWFSVRENSRRRAFIRFDNSGKLGFYGHQSHNVVDINNCIILEPELESLLAPLKELSVKLNVAVEGWMVTNTDSGIDIVLYSEDKKKLKSENMIFEELSRFSNANHIARMGWRRNKALVPVVTIKKPALNINGRQIMLPGEYFLQASRAGQEAILSAVIPHVPQGAKLLDLFSGLGIYGFALADTVRNACSYEISQEMIDSLEGNIANNKLSDKISAYCRDIDSFPLQREELTKFDAAIINPPRTGALAQISVIAAARIPLVIIVSCNSLTFARDAKILHEKGYKMKSLNAIDQFYYSHHLEQVGVFYYSG